MRRGRVLVAVLGLGACRPAAPVSVSTSPASAADEQALIDRGPFLLLAFAREALARRDFAGLAAYVEQHARREPTQWHARADLELVVACWSGDLAGLAGQTRRYVAEICLQADDEVRARPRRAGAEPMCRVMGTPIDASRIVGSAQCRQVVESTYRDIDAATVAVRRRGW